MQIPLDSNKVSCSVRAREHKVLWKCGGSPAIDTHGNGVKLEVRNGDGEARFLHKFLSDPEIARDHSLSPIC